MKITFTIPPGRYFIVPILALFVLISCDVGDDIPPAPITDLRVSENEKVFNWTAPGDDGDVGRARLYLMRYLPAEEVKLLLNVNSLEGVSQQEIQNVVQENFDIAIQIPTFFAPQVAGSTESFAVPRIDIDGSETFYFAVSTNDEVGNNSGPSNVVDVRTSLMQSQILSDEEGSCIGMAVASSEIGGKDETAITQEEFIRDLIIGDPCNDKVYVFFGGADVVGDSGAIDLGQADMTIIGNPGESFGASVSSIGHFALRSIFEELIIGAPDANNGAGKAYIFFGRPEQPAVIDLSSGDQPDILIEGESPGDNFGFTVRRRGSNDVFVGAPGALNNRGRVYRFDGPSLDEVTEASSANDIYTGESGQGMFGFDIADARNLDRRSPNDFVVSAPGLGRVYVIFENRDIDLSQDLSDVLVIQGSTDDRFGESVSAGFNTNGFIDNINDLTRDTDVLIGAPGANNGAGSVFLYTNSDIVTAFRDGGPLNFSVRIDGTEPGANFGASVSIIGDINPDVEAEDRPTAIVLEQEPTNADILIGAPGAQGGTGQAFIFFGREGFSGNFTSGDADIVLTPPSGVNSYGSHVFEISDINGDNFNDFAIGASNSVFVGF